MCKPVILGAQNGPFWGGCSVSASKRVQQSKPPNSGHLLSPAYRRDRRKPDGPCGRGASGIVTDHGGDFSDDRGFPAIDGGKRVVFREKPDLAILNGEPFDSSFIFEESHNNFALIRAGLLVDDDDVTREDTSAQHGLAPDSEREELALSLADIVRDIFFDALLGENRDARGDVAHDRNAVDGRGRFRQGDCSALPRALGDHASGFQVLKVEMDSGRGFKTYGLADFAHRGRISLGLNGGNNVVVDFLLHTS